MRRTLIILIVLVILSIIGMSGYYFIHNFTYTRHITLPPQLLASSSTDALDGTDTDGPFINAFGQKNADAINPASSTIDVSQWKTFTNNELGFSVKYPKDLVANTNLPSSLVLAVPKDKYFHWPLLDDAKITITATSTCPSLVGGGMMLKKPSSVAVGDYIYVRSESNDAAAGNVYREMAFDMNHDDICYHISLFVHGANGAGLYVSGQALITQYDTQHQADLDRLVSVFMGIVRSFMIVQTPDGASEDQAG